MPLSKWRRSLPRRRSKKERTKESLIRPFAGGTGVEKVDILPGDKGTEFKPPVDLYHIRVKRPLEVGFEGKICQP